MGISIDADLLALDRDITALRVEYESFLSGGTKKPPIASRKKVEEILRRLGNTEIDKAAERFRLQTVQGRYRAMVELWEKRLVAKEEGRGVFARSLRERLGETPTGEHPPATGPVATASGAAAPANESTPGSVRAKGKVDFTPLFQRYCAARKALGEDVSKLRYERFEELVRKQAEEIRRRTGSSKLMFEVVTQDGKVKLIGRPSPAKPKPE